ncbi:MAG: class I SAM-dependent methyltransferase [Planctomycetota bacterium]
MEILQRNIYDFPKYYDLVYGSDWKAEFDFLNGVFAAHSSHPVGNVFEPACGTGRLIYRFARAGFRVGGNDLNRSAIEYCNERLRRAGSTDNAMVGDMTDFNLQQPVDAAFNTINSFRHLNSETLAANHLGCMADAIRKDGLYVLGLHLSPESGETCDSESWSATRGYLTVNSSMWLVERDYESRFERFGMTFDVYTPTRQFQIRDEVAFRTYTAIQIQSLIEQNGRFDIEAVYDFHYDLEQPIELNESIEDVVLVLKRK